MIKYLYRLVDISIRFVLTNILSREISSVPLRKKIGSRRYKVQLDRLIDYLPCYLWSGVSYKLPCVQ
jgi:hypothetical protein